MTGHLDDAEIDQISPIYSFSFGLSCVFLIGGTTKESKPLPVRLDSGDLLSKNFVMQLWADKAENAITECRESSLIHMNPQTSL